MKIESFFDRSTFTLTYVVYDEVTLDAVVIDPVLDFDASSGAIDLKSYNIVKEFIKDNSLKLHFVLETHAHADHLSSSKVFKNDFPIVQVAIGEGIKKVQKTFKKVFNLSELSVEGDQFDLLLQDGETYQVGSLSFKAIATPGHTPACMSFLFEDNLFTGDALFMPDFGTGRCDFPEGSAEDLYTSIHEKIYPLGDDVKIFVGHDYQPGGRELQYSTDIRTSKKDNIQLKQETTREQFVEFRTTRDAKLNAPKLLLPSIQVNINAGELPSKEDNGTSYLKLPLSGEII